MTTDPKPMSTAALRKLLEEREVLPTYTSYAKNLRMNAALLKAVSDWICECVPAGTRGATYWAIKLHDAARAQAKEGASHG